MVGVAPRRWWERAWQESETPGQAFPRLGPQLWLFFGQNPPLLIFSQRLAESPRNLLFSPLELQGRVGNHEWRGDGGEPRGAQPRETSGTNPWASLMNLNGTGGGAADALQQASPGFHS